MTNDAIKNIKKLTKSTKLLTREDLQELRFQVNDAIRLTGFTYRQIRNWDEKGALTSNRRSAVSWRKFGIDHLFALMVCSTIHKTFGTPLSSLKKLQTELSVIDPSNFTYTVGAMMYSEFCVYLLTDLEKTFYIDHESGFQELLKRRALRDKNQTGFIFLNLNPIVNNLMRTLNLPKIKVQKEWYKLFHSMENPLKIHIKAKKILKKWKC